MHTPMSKNSAYMSRTGHTVTFVIGSHRAHGGFRDVLVIDVRRSMSTRTVVIIVSHRAHGGHRDVLVIDVRRSMSAYAVP